MLVTTKTRLHYRIQTAVFMLLFLAVIGMLAWLSTQYTWQDDWTFGKRNSLSADTIQLLTTLQAPVHVRSYQPEDGNLQQGARDILLRYQQHKTDLDFRIVNPDLEPDLAKADGIREYGQSVIKYGEQQQIVDALDETSISNALLRLSRSQAPLLAFVVGHGERDITDQSNTGYAMLQKQLREQGFVFSQINLLSDAITDEVRVLVIAGANHEFVAGEVDKILAYLQQGGHLLWLTDPQSKNNLDKLFAQLGLQMIPGIMVDTNAQLRATLRTPHPAILPILAYGEHAITKDLRYHTLFSLAAAFKHHSAQTDWQATPFLLSLPDSSWSETGNFFADVKLNEKSGDTPGPLALGYALEKKQDNNTQRVVVMGDSDFLANSNLGAAANLTLIQNVLNWLAEDDALINIAPKSAPDTNLQLNKTELAMIGFGFLIVLPLFLAASGFWIWYSRRKR